MSEMEKTLVETKMTLAEVCLLPCYLDHMLMTPAGEFSTRSSEAEMDRPPQSCWRLIYPLPLLFDHATSRPSRLVQHSSRQFNSTLSSFEPHFSSSGSTMHHDLVLAMHAYETVISPFLFGCDFLPQRTLYANNVCYDCVLNGMSREHGLRLPPALVPGMEIVYTLVELSESIGEHGRTN